MPFASCLWPFLKEIDRYNEEKMLNGFLLKISSSQFAQILFRFTKIAFSTCINGISISKMQIIIGRFAFIKEDIY
jgi:hypothetical protein